MNSHLEQADTGRDTLNNGVSAALWPFRRIASDHFTIFHRFTSDYMAGHDLQSHVLWGGPFRSY
jgi:hypothetical protein